MFLVCGEALYDVFVDKGDHPNVLNMNALAGGSPFNVAIGLARLDQPSALLTGLSNDELGKRLVQVLENESVNQDYLVRTERSTTLVMVSVSETGQPDYAFYGAGSADCGVTIDELPSIGGEISGIHFGSYSLVVNPVAEAFAELLKRIKDQFISLDPNIRPTIEPDMDIWRERVDLYSEHAELLKISAEDMDYLYPGVSKESIVDSWMEKGVELVVITDGSDAVRSWSRSGFHYKHKPVNSHVVDTVGAGDSFHSALLMQLLHSGDPKKSLSELDQQGLKDLISFSAQAAYITCSRKGANLPFARELSEYRNFGVIQ